MPTPASRRFSTRIAASSIVSPTRCTDCTAGIPKLLSRMNTIVVVFEHQSSNDLAAVMRAFRHTS